MVYTSFAVNGYSVVGGVVAGIDIDNSGTQFRILNSAGEVVYGPVGEGVAPLSGTTSEEVFELENDPTPAVSPIIATSDETQGYDDEATDSTFGEQNTRSVETDLVIQDFSAYVATGFVLWAEAEDLSGADALADADPDLDGRDNFNEYAFGGDPSIKDGSYPTGPAELNGQLSWSYVRRSSDPGLSFSYEASEALADWDPVIPASASATPFVGDGDFETVTLSFDLPIPAPLKWFVRGLAD